jgi:hypothetical protein
LKVGNPESQKCHFHQTERITLSTFIAGLLTYAATSQTPAQALQNPVTVFEAEAQEKRKETFLAN